MRVNLRVNTGPCVPNFQEKVRMTSYKLNPESTTSTMIFILIASMLLSISLAFSPPRGWCQDSSPGPAPAISNQARAKAKDASSVPSASSDKPEPAPAALAVPIARVGDTSITAADLEEYLTYRPLSSPSSPAREAIEQRLDEMITSEALYQEALRRNLHQDPKMRRIIRQILTQKLMEDEVEKKVFSRTIGREEIQSYYDQHANEFNRPEQVRLADIFIAGDPKADPKRRAERKKKAEGILAEALEGKRKMDFGELIKKYSDSHPQYPLGDTGYFDAEGKPVGLEAKLAEEAFKLRSVGQICDHLVETPQGYHVIMLVEKRPAIRVPLDEVKSHLERRIRNRELEEKQNAYIEQIKEKSAIQKHEQALSEFIEKMKEARKKESKEGSGQEKGHSHPALLDTDAPPPFPGEE